MTPKEKAEELINKMHNTEHCYIKHFPNERYCDCIAMNAFQAKQCALIAVNEIIDSYTHELENGYILSEKIIPYWQEVKQEIVNS